MEALLISEIVSSNTDIYKRFISVGLEQDEEHFRITPNDDRDAPFPTRDTEDSFTLGAWYGNTLAGVVSFERDGKNREKLRHKGILFRMYVSKEYRGQGIAPKLIEALLARVRSIGDIECINLTVIATNARAKTLYERFGFTTFGSEERAIKWKNTYFTEDQMVLRLR